MMKLAIIAGGKGTRLGLKYTPKPMALIAGKPILEHHINLAKRYGIKDISILSGYSHQVIIDYFEDGAAFGVNITHIVEKNPRGTAGAVKQLKAIFDERFMVFYGDVFCDIDLDAFTDFDMSGNSIATIIVHPNDHPYDSDLLDMDDNDIVTAIYSKPRNDDKYYRNLVNAAVYILDPGIFQYIPDDRPSDFGKDIFPSLLKAGERVKGYRTAEYIKDMGTMDRLTEVANNYGSGKVSRFSKRNKRPAIFIDRDGTLVEGVDLLHKADDLQLYGNSASAVKKINRSDYACFLITNQPVVARNLCDIATVKQIHNKLETLLGKSGAYLNDIYFCPHHPDKGYPEENADFKIDCECRKPKTGMIDKATEEYNIDIKASWFIGDTTTDIQTGRNAGMKTILVRTGKGGRDDKFDLLPDLIFDNIEYAVDYILNTEEREDNR